MKKYIFTFFLFLLHLGVNAQYVEPEKSVKEEMERKKNEVIHLPKQKFDSIEAKNMLALGKGQIKGVAFTRARDSKNFGIKTGDKIKANKITITLFPVTSYFQEYLTLWKDKSKNNPKKNSFVYMDPAAFRYRLEAITNSDGEFTFPDMKPGKYYLFGIISYTTSNTKHQYTGSGYDAYGRIDYYSPYQTYKDYSEYIDMFVEVKSEGEIVNVKLK